MDEHRGGHGERDGRPQPVRGELGSLADAVGEVVDRPDAAHPEERDHAALTAVEARLRAEQRQETAERTDDEDESESDDDAAPVEVLQQPSAQGDAQRQQQHQRQQPLEPLGDVVHRGVVVVVPLGGSEGHRGGEDRQEAVAVGDLREAVRRDQRGQGGQRLTPLGDAQRVALGVEGDVGQHPADHDADRDPDHDLADEVPRDPLPPGEAPGTAGGDQGRAIDERERQPVVEARLAGEGEAQLVRLVDLGVTGLRAGDLDVGGQDGVRGGEGARQQER